MRCDGRAGKTGCGAVGQCNITRAGCSESSIEGQHGVQRCEMYCKRAVLVAHVPQNLSDITNLVGKKGQARSARKATCLCAEETMRQN